MAYTPLPTTTSGTGVADITAVVFTGSIASNIIDQYTGEMITLKKSDDKIQGGTLAPGDIDGYLYFNLSGDYYVRNLPLDCVDIRWFDPAANGSTNDYTKIASAVATRKKVLFPNKQFKLDSSLNTDYLNIEANKTEFIFDATVANCMAIYGTAGAAITINADGILGYNYVDSAALKAAVAPGDMVLLRDDTAFTTKPSYANYRGETKEVFRIVDNKVFFTTPLHDNYASASNFRAYKIAPGFCRIEGDLTVYSGQTDYVNGTAKGFDLYLCYKPFLRNVKVKNCVHAAIWVNSCFQADLVVNVSSSLKTLNGYGVAIINATCESRFSGTWTNCRHTLATGGGSSELGGIPHCNKVYDVVSAGGDNNACIDCHPPTGLIEFENIMCIGGPIEPVHSATGVTNPSGINVGARYIVIRGLTAIQLNNAIVVRSEADIDRLDVSDVSIFDCVSLIQCVNEGTLKKLTINGVKGNLSGIALSLGATNTVDPVKMDEMTITDVTLTCSYFLYTYVDLHLPDTILFNNVQATGLSVGTTKTGTGLSLNDGSTGVQVIRCTNCTFQNFQYGMRMDAAKSLKEFSMTGCNFYANEYHIYVNGTANGTPEIPVVRFDLFRSNGDRFKVDSARSGSTTGVVHMQRAYHMIVDAIVDNYVCPEEPHFFSNNTYIGTLYSGNGISETILSVAESIKYYEIVAGTKSAPAIVKGTGSPEGVVTARYSTIYLQKNAKAAYIKGTDTGSTGWVAFA